MIVVSHPYPKTQSLIVLGSVPCRIRWMMRAILERIEAPVPVALEWAIGYLSFPQAEATDGYACQLNSEYVSFASLLRGESKRKGLNFRTLIKQARNGADVSVPLESICVVSERYVKSAYGFFLGKRVAYPVVANYVRNTWGKYGLVKYMFSSSIGLFFFQFSSVYGFDSMLKNGPWFICNNPLILKKWNPDVNLIKEDVVNFSVWVKPHGVPVTAFTKDGLSAIAMNIGTLLRLNSYTSNMCIQSLGRSSYARALIEFRADVKFKDTILTPRGVPVGSNVGFKPTKEYRPVAKKPNANTSCNKKKGVKPTKESVYPSVITLSLLSILSIRCLVGYSCIDLVSMFIEYAKGCSHILVLGDGAQMLGFPCLNGCPSCCEYCIYLKTNRECTCGWVNCELSHPDANITFVLRPTENILCGWVNCEVTHPDASIAFVLRPMEDVLPWLGCSHILVLGDGAQMLGFSCLNGKDPTSTSARIQGPTPVMVFAIILLRVTIVIVCKLPSGMEKYKIIVVVQQDPLNGSALLKKKINSQGYQDTMTLFSTVQFRKATNNYFQEQIVGRGGYGVVYKGVLSDKRVITIKKSKIVDDIGQNPIRHISSRTRKCFTTMSKIDRNKLHNMGIDDGDNTERYGIWETIVAKDGVTANEKKENTSKVIIFQTLPQDILMQVAQYSTKKEVRDSIKVKNLETLRIKPNEKVSGFGGKLSSIIAKFKGLGETLDDKVLSQDTLETNDQDKLLMESSNNKSYGKWRGKYFNKEGKESMKWKNNPNARRASTSQGIKDKSKLRCYECDKSRPSVCDYRGEYWPKPNPESSIQDQDYFQQMGAKQRSFINELLILTQVIRQNVVKLLGCCLEEEVHVLVYDFISNNTLYHHIHHRLGGVSWLSWENRLKIAAEAAGALSYLR
nr:hypothetical protein [Tanacetum cinerariifolium]